MQTAGFILTGGESRRFGRDKALLDWQGSPLVSDLAARVKQSAGSVTLVGQSTRYGHLGLACVDDLRPGKGPLSGIETALTISQAPLNLIVACDMPLLGAALCQLLLSRMELANADAAIPRSPDGALHPACAAYHKRCLALVSESLDRGRFRLHGLLDRLTVHLVDVPQDFVNVNTPEDLERAKALH